MSNPDESVRLIPVRRVRDGAEQSVDDSVAVEEPMEIRIAHGPDGERKARSLSITMRTPGNDFELACGFLYTEGIVDGPDQVRDVVFCGPPAPGRKTSNIVKVELTPDVDLDPVQLERHFYTTSSCGICGKASLEALEVQKIAALDRDRLRLDAGTVERLPDQLRASQPLFDRTGGIHAAALVDAAGNQIAVREDVGRHNAVDKLIGRRFLDRATPIADHAMVVSGRASFEILQKALVAGVAMIVAVGAPSSLAVELAGRFDMTLIGFAGVGRFNVYSGAHRVGGRVPKRG